MTTEQQRAIALARARRRRMEGQQPAPQPAPVQEPPPIGSGLARSWLGGMTFNFGDELRGAASAALGAATGQGDFSDLYRVTRDYERQQGDQFREAHPVLSGAAELTGGLMTGGLGGAKVAGTQAGRAAAQRLAALPTGQRIAQTAKMGAAGGGLGGAVAGAGAANELSDIPGEAAIGATIGTARSVVGWSGFDHQPVLGH